MTGGQDAAHFAARLTELKSRTDRSYGSLARRLGMNTSTLHRYCAGEAVPQDFAPVERLAGFCGATPEERLELHRLWLRALEERQGRGRKEEDAGYEADVDDGSGGEVAEADAGAEPVAPPAPSDAEPVVQDASPPPPRPWYRRRAAVLAAVACVVAATIGTLSALPQDRRAPAPGATAQAGDGVPSLSSRPGKLTASPGPSPSGSGSPSPSEKGAAPSPGASKSPSASPSPKPGTGTPLTWTADSHVWAEGCGHDYVVDRPPAEVPPPPMSQDARAWAVAENALHGRETMVRIAVQGRSETAVVLEGLRVRVTGRTTPAAGNAYAMDQGCGGSLTPREFAVDLDKDRPIARSMPGNDAGTVLPAVSFPYRVSAKDPEILLVTARTAGCDCSWYLELDWSSQGRTGTVRIDDAGRPFRTTAITGLPRYMYDTLNRNWRPYAE